MNQYCLIILPLTALKDDEELCRKQRAPLDFAAILRNDSFGLRHSFVIRAYSFVILSCRFVIFVIRHSRNFHES